MDSYATCRIKRSNTTVSYSSASDAFYGEVQFNAVKEILLDDNRSVPYFIGFRTLSKAVDRLVWDLNEIKTALFANKVVGNILTEKNFVYIVL